MRLDEFIQKDTEEVNEIINYNDFPLLNISNEMLLTGMFIDRIDDLLVKDIDYTEEALSDIFRKIKTHIENSFNNLKYIINKKDIKDISEMEKFTNENKRDLKILFTKFNHIPMEGIDLFRFEKQKHSYIVSIKKVNKMFKEANVSDFIQSMEHHLNALVNADDILKASRNKKYDNKFKSNSTINNFLKDMYSKKEKTTDTLRKGSYLFKNVSEMEKCINECLKFKDIYKESSHITDMVKNMEKDVDNLLHKLDISTELSKGQIKQIYNNLDMRMISNSLSLYGIMLQLYMSIEHNVILSTKKLMSTLSI